MITSKDNPNGEDYGPSTRQAFLAQVLTVINTPCLAQDTQHLPKACSPELTGFSLPRMSI